MTEPQLELFGKYLLIQQIATGGMAEIFLARPATVSANGRILILKRILSQVTLSHQDFVKMFESEIKVTMGFNHPHIVQIYDFGKFEGRHFIAMEYIEGKSVHEIKGRFRALGQKIPISAAVEIVAQVAEGLQYAHEYKNHVTGEALNVVHRDISPQNILVSYEGKVKIIDFGIAKSTRGSSEKTQTGLIKGKISYLSPEQLHQRDLDGRSDLFSLGVVFWELLTGKKLFVQEGQSDLAIMDAIDNCDAIIVPPSSLDPNVPAALDQIVLRCLHKDRELRYSSAEELRKELLSFLKNFDGVQSPLGALMKEVFQTRIEEERQSLKILNQRAQERLEEWGGSGKILTMVQSGAFSSHTIVAAPVREPFYIKLTIPRAIGLLIYAATLLILRLDHQQVVLNAIFGGWNSPDKPPQSQQARAAENH